MSVLFVSEVKPQFLTAATRHCPTADLAVTTYSHGIMTRFRVVKIKLTP